MNQMGYFCKIICHEELSKIAQPGHTDYITKLGLKINFSLLDSPS